MTDGVTIKVGKVFMFDVRGTKVTLAMIGAMLVCSGVPVDAVYAAISSFI